MHKTYYQTPSFGLLICYSILSYSLHADKLVLLLIGFKALFWFTYFNKQFATTIIAWAHQEKGFIAFIITVQQLH
jgi:hypothetical protein